MNKVKIKVVIDLENPEHVNAINSIKADIYQAENASETTAKPAAAKPEKPTAKKEDKPAAAKAESKPAKKEKEDKPSEKGGLTRDDVRELMADKVTGNRETIKAKLTELDATKLSNLKEENFEAFYLFLESL